MTHYLRKFGIAGKHTTEIPTQNQYIVAYKKAVREIKKLSEAQLDNKILEKNKTYIKRFHDLRKKRLDAYNSAHWFLAIVSIKELGVWKGAGGLPKSWTKEPLNKLSQRIKKALKISDYHIKARSRRAIPSIIQLKNTIQNDRYSIPIVFESGMGTNGRAGLPKTKFDIDDGNMRAIAYAVSSDKRLKVYVGITKKNA